ncbi:MAG: hypothetical protein EHM91_16135 [Planctomycetota bacterium]|nr:MAG: hypothetical protein EHM91_16135 [Planctomycetota bacterium]
MTEELNDEDKVISARLRSIRVTVDLQNAPMTAIVDRLREISGLNIHAPGIDGPNCEAITFKVKDVVVGQALRQLLEPRNRTYRVRDGVVLITVANIVDVVSEDGSKVLVGGSGLAVGSLLAVTRDSRFVALLRVEEVRDVGGLARVLPGLAVGRILPGDHAVLVTDPKGYLAALPEQVRMDLSSRANQQAMRAKMGLKQ